MKVRIADDLRIHRVAALAAGAGDCGRLPSVSPRSRRRSRTSGDCGARGLC